MLIFNPEQKYKKKQIKQIMNKREIKKVKAKHGSGLKLAKLFGVTTKTVSHALNGRSNNDLARKIRKTAVHMGGDPIYND